jgi:MFS family permease
MNSDLDLRGNRWGVLGIIMLGTFMAILDSSIVNVALPHMMSSFGVDRDKIEWVSTGYLLTSAVVMPLVGWLTTRISYKALYLGSLFIFTVPALCAPWRGATSRWSPPAFCKRRAVARSSPSAWPSSPSSSSRTNAVAPWASGAQASWSAPRSARPWAVT